MKRKTWKRSMDGYEDVGLQDGISVGDAICDLAAYEDTGLEPQDYSKMFVQLLEYKDLGTLSRLRELAEADNEGRCVILPKTKAPDPPYRLPVPPRVNAEAAQAGEGAAE